MLITTPSEITNVLYEGPLEFSKTATERAVNHYGESARQELAGYEPPTVTIGEPVWWNVAEVYREEGKPLPTMISLLLRNADFFLAQLACSLRPGHSNNTRVEWARFAVYLRPRNTAASNPIALDLYPFEVYDKAQRDVQIRLAPMLKFVEAAEASLGEVALELKYNKLIPVITAAGAQESNFSWDLQETKEHPLRGARFFHALVKRPHGAGGVRASFEVVADVVTPHGVLQSALREQVAANLSRVICD